MNDINLYYDLTSPEDYWILYDLCLENNLVNWIDSYYSIPNWIFVIPGYRGGKKSSAGYNSFSRSSDACSACNSIWSPNCHLV
jgi:hypothetical protein